MKKLLVIVLCFAARTLLAQVSSSYERILLPVSTDEIPGSFGSRWVTDLWYRNDGDEPAAVFPLAVTDYTPSPHVDVLLPVIKAGPGGPPGAFLYVTRSLADNLRFNLRVRDLSRQALTWGTQIPVVREAQFSSKRLVLLAVPIDAHFRALLRIYDASFGFVTARVRVFELGSDTLLAQRDMQLSSVPELPYDPGYAQLAISDIVAATNELRVVRVEIEPLTPMRFWAFVSVTNNETQQVTTVVP